MEVLSINTVYKLLLAKDDILPVFQKNYRELESITQRACLHLDDGTIMLKPGLRLDFDRFIEALYAVNDQNQQKESTATPNNDISSLLKLLINKYKISENNNLQDSYSFLIAFLENIFSNLQKNKNNYRYSEAVLNFAQALFVLAGRNAYEFVRLNLPGALPALSTLDDIFEKADANIEEGIFRYDLLYRQQNSLGHQIALKYWFENNDTSNYLNIHMVQPLMASDRQSSPYLLAAYGISNTFTAIDVFNRWMWIFESSRQSNVRIVAFATDCDSSDFLTYDNIQTTISRAFDHAYHLLSGLDVNIALEKKKKTTLKQVSSFVRTQFEKKFKTISADSSQIYSSDDESDDESESDVYMLSKPEEYSSSEDETDDVPQITTNGKSQFRGMRVFDTISPSLTNSFFCVEIDGKKKYVHKQTACWLLTDKKPILSADRLKRVQQSSR
ncbi:unnamed protein product [Rotaria sp. Silwood2]|nr:unnamed protein product [Rotaria sp. Silwood2]CAF4295512.1 unnamed protein product [Rotaria sp. Silwood2]